MTGRAGRPEPARFGPGVFFGGFVAVAAAVGVGVGVEVEVAVEVGVAVEVAVANIGATRSSEGTSPGFPVFHGIGSGSSSFCRPSSGNASDVV